MDRSEMHPEAGDLGHTFEALLQEMERVRQESHAANRLLRQRNRELAAAAAVAQAISAGEMDLAGTLEQALQVVLEVTGVPAGWIHLFPEAGGEPVMANSAGLSQEVAEALARYRSPECECRKTPYSHQPVVVHPFHAGCPLLALDLGANRPLTCHVTVPLLARSRVLGVLNLAGDDLALFDEQEIMLLNTLGGQLGVAIENTRLWDELKKRDALRGQMLEQAIAAQEDERRHIARELHDQTGQALTSILVWLRALEAEANGSAGVTVSPNRLQEFKAIVADSLDGVHDLALELRPSVLDDLGLVPALQRYVHTHQDRHQLAIDLQTVGLERARLLPSVETALYRIVQEALTNVVQHAGACGVSLLLEVRAGSIVAIVEDDGCGFDTGPLMRGEMDERWLGLSGMRERAELLGGRLTIESAPGTGTTVFVEVPLR